MIFIVQKYGNVKGRIQSFQGTALKLTKDMPLPTLSTGQLFYESKNEKTIIFHHQF